jgi:hypothetical protein
MGRMIKDDAVPSLSVLNLEHRIINAILSRHFLDLRFKI